jgi:hypothetical protein
VTSQPPYRYDPQNPWTASSQFGSPSAAQDPSYPPVYPPPPEYYRQDPPAQRAEPAPPPAYPSQPLYPPSGYPYAGQPGYPYPMMYAPPGYGMPGMPGMPWAQPDQRRGLALAGMILGISSLTAEVLFFVLAGLSLPAVADIVFLAALPVSIVGIVLSALGRKSVSRRAMAITGLVLSIIALVLWVVLFALAIVAAIYLIRTHQIPQ